MMCKLPLAALLLVLSGNPCTGLDSNVTVCTCSHGTRVLDNFETTLKELHNANRLLYEKVDALVKSVMNREHQPFWMQGGSTERTTMESVNNREHPSLNRHADGTETTKYPWKPRNCLEAQREYESDPDLKSGSFQIYNPQIWLADRYVPCEMERHGGGWMSIMRHGCGDADFDQTWTAYKFGFGYVSSEFWLGLEAVHLMTTQEPHELLILLKTFDDELYHARYSNFIVGPEHQKYDLKSLGKYSGDAGDSLSYHLGMEFLTLDVAHTLPEYSERRECAIQYRGGWWFKSCFECHLTGVCRRKDLPYLTGGILWNTISKKTPMQYAEMFIRPSKP